MFLRFRGNESKQIAREKFGEQKKERGESERKQRRVVLNKHRRNVLCVAQSLACWKNLISPPTAFLMRTIFATWAKKHGVLSFVEWKR